MGDVGCCKCLWCGGRQNIEGRAERSIRPYFERVPHAVTRFIICFYLERDAVRVGLELFDGGSLGGIPAIELRYRRASHRKISRDLNIADGRPRPFIAQENQ